MRIRADFDQIACVQSADEAWVDAPAKGVQRIMLDRIGEELARATSLVRFEAGAAFPTHTHGGGEEFLVLDGVFEDEAGAYPTGTYVRNPVGSSHQPSCPQGAVILVKLHQMQATETGRTVVGSDSSAWAETDFGSVLELFRDANEHVTLQRWRAGSTITPAHHPGGVEIFTLSGRWRLENADARGGTWLRLPAHSGLNPEILEDSVVWMKSGHVKAAALCQNQPPVT